MARAIWNGTVLADTDDVVVDDGFTYFPGDSVAQDLVVEGPHTSVPPRKELNRLLARATSPTGSAT